MDTSERRIIPWQQIAESTKVFENEFGINYHVDGFGIVYTPTSCLEEIADFNNNCECLIVTYQAKHIVDRTWIMARVQSLGTA